MFKKLLQKLPYFLVGSIALLGALSGTTALSACLNGYQGGTGICSATSTDVGKVLTVSSSTPWLTYTFSTPSSGGSATTTISAGGITIQGPNFTLATSTNGSDWTVTASGTTFTFNFPTSIYALLNKAVLSGPGTSTQVAYYTGTSSLTSSANLTTDGTNLTSGGYIQLNDSTQPAGISGALRLNSSVMNGISRIQLTNPYTVNGCGILGRDNCQIVKNTTGGNLTIGQAVYINGSTGINPTVLKSQANSTTTAVTLGLVATTTVANNGFFYVMTKGILTNVDTSAWAAADVLYVSPTTAGGLTNVRPSYPNLITRVGKVLVSNASVGQIDVQVAPAVLGQETGTISPTFNIGGSNAITTTSLLAGTNITITNGATSTTISSTGGSGTPGGSNTQVQFNNNSNFGADSDFSYTSSSKKLSLSATSSQVVIGTSTLNGNFFTSVLASSTVVSFSGASTTWTVPSNISGNLTINAIGASGGGASAGSGNGQSATTTITLTPGTILYINVGGGGGGSTVGGLAGYNGGGISPTSSGSGGGGGGFTIVATSSNLLSTSTALIVAAGSGGGGRGAGAAGTGGDAGYPNGSSGSGTAPGGGGTQSAGGTAGSSACSATAGSLFQGGNGCYSGTPNQTGGGAGGGIYGGGGAAASAGDGGGGGGGSGWFSPSSISTSTASAGNAIAGGVGSNGNNGKVTFTYNIISNSLMARPSSFSLAVGGHIITGNNSTATTTVSSCGTNPSFGGSDTAGAITAGAGTVTSCVLNFAVQFSTAPVCVANAATSTTPVAVAPTSVSVSSITLTTAANIGNGGKIYYHCLSY